MYMSLIRYLDVAHLKDAELNTADQKHSPADHADVYVPDHARNVLTNWWPVAVSHSLF